MTTNHLQRTSSTLSISSLSFTHHPFSSHPNHETLATTSPPHQPSPSSPQPATPSPSSSNPTTNTNISITRHSLVVLTSSPATLNHLRSLSGNHHKPPSTVALTPSPATTIVTSTRHRRPHSPPHTSLVATLAPTALTHLNAFTQIPNPSHDAAFNLDETSNHQNHYPHSPSLSRPHSSTTSQQLNHHLHLLVSLTTNTHDPASLTLSFATANNNNQTTTKPQSSPKNQHWQPP